MGLCACSHVVVLVLGQSVRLSWYHMWWCGVYNECDACAFVCVGCEYAERV